MIPKIIHYCWFGKGEKSEQILKCIDSWHRFFPDYQYIEWNEDNCDINEIPYIRQAYQAKKYAFVSDYIRIKALVEYGGIYFDTDYEVIKPMDNILSQGKLITGLENSGSALTAMIAVESNNDVMREFLYSYIQRNFIFDNGEMDMTPINQGFSSLLSKCGIDLISNKKQVLENGIVMYPIEILCGFDVENWHEKITQCTVGVHHMGNSWATPEMKKHVKRIQFLQKVLGYKNYDKFREFIKNRRFHG